MIILTLDVHKRNTTISYERSASPLKKIDSKRHIIQSCNIFMHHLAYLHKTIEMSLHLENIIHTWKTLYEKRHIYSRSQM